MPASERRRRKTGNKGMFDTKPGCQFNSGFFWYNRRIAEEFNKKVSDHFMPREAGSLPLISVILQCFLEKRKKKQNHKTKQKTRKATLKTAFKLSIKRKKIYYLLQKILSFLNGIRTRLTESKVMVVQCLFKHHKT